MLPVLHLIDDVSTNMTLESIIIWPTNGCAVAAGMEHVH